MNAPKIQWHQDSCYARLPAEWGIAECFRRLSAIETTEATPRTNLLDRGHGKHLALLDSSACQPGLGRYSYLACWPCHWFELPAAREILGQASNSAGMAPGLAELRQALSSTHPISQFSSPQPDSRIPGLPPFQGGAIAMFAYEYGCLLENIGFSAIRTHACPALAFGIYDCLLAWDNEAEGGPAGWLVASGQGLPVERPSPIERIEQWWQQLLALFQSPSPPTIGQSPVSSSDISEQAAAAERHDIPGFASLDVAGLSSNMSQQQYLEKIASAVDRIYAGDIFQVNIAQQLQIDAHCDAATLFLALRQHNPAPFAGYFETDTMEIASSSPELFLRVQDGAVETRPIKGTARRSHYPEADLVAATHLAQSVKDRAENTMIVDLMRNDLSRVCSDASIQVTQLCEVEKFRSVLHLVSAVTGQLKPGCDVIDLLAATFPGGSITGAPKIRAMQIIAELEPTERGPYCGSLGYIGFDGDAVFNILIRTVTASNNRWAIPVGGGIVAQSQPQSEYDETWAKAAGMLRAVRQTRRADSRAGDSLRGNPSRPGAGS